jgi:hypothetical protein
MEVKGEGGYPLLALPWNRGEWRSEEPMIEERCFEKNTLRPMRVVAPHLTPGVFYAPCETERLQAMTLYSQEIETRRAVDSLSIAARQYCRIRYRFANGPKHGSHWTT